MVKIDRQIWKKWFKCTSQSWSTKQWHATVTSWKIVHLVFSGAQQRSAQRCLLQLAWSSRFCYRSYVKLRSTASSPVQTHVR